MSVDTYFSYEDEYFRMDIQSDGRRFYVHQQVYKYTPESRIRTEMLLDWLEQSITLYVAVPSGSTTLYPYARQFGFQPSALERNEYDGKNYLLLTRI